MCNLIDEHVNRVKCNDTRTAFVSNLHEIFSRGHDGWDNVKDHGTMK